MPAVVSSGKLSDYYASHEVCDLKYAVSCELIVLDQLTAQ